MAIRPLFKKRANKGSRVIDCSSAVLFWSPNNCWIILVNPKENL
jgi:hypothetical protein